MTKFKFNTEPTWLESLTMTALNSLSVNNKRVTEGSDEVIRNFAYDKIADDELIGRVEDVLSKFMLTVTLREIEDSNRSKFGPRSIAKSWEDRRSSLLDYFSDQDLYDEWTTVSKGGLRPATIPTVKNNLLKSSSAGLPYMRRKGLVLKDAIESWEKQKGVYPCVLYTRTQEQGKTRNVWGYPVSDTIWEQQYFLPVLVQEKKLAFRSALLGPDFVDSAMTRLMVSKSKYIYCVDFSAFDASVSPNLSGKAFDLIRSWFRPEYQDGIVELYNRFATIPIVTPDGQYEGAHGVPSGSSFTNTVDSLVQYIVSEADEHKCSIQGDDGVYLVDTDDDLDLLRNRFKDAGLVLNLDKSQLFDTQEAVFLQRYYHPLYKSRKGGFGGVYSAHRAFNRIKYLERWTDFKAMDISDSDFFALRTITILENCKHHPAFKEIVLLARSCEPNRLTYSQHGLHAYSRAQESKTRAGVYNQYGLQRGIENFEVVKVLRENP